MAGAAGSFWGLIKRAFGFKFKKRRFKNPAKRKQSRHKRAAPGIPKKKQNQNRRRKIKTGPKKRRLRKIKKKTAAGFKKSSAKKKIPKKAVGIKWVEAGRITHFFPKVKAAVIFTKKTISIGEPVWIKGATTDFKQTVCSLQIDRKPVEKLKPGIEAGLEVGAEVRVGDHVFVVKKG